MRTFVNITLIQLQYDFGPTGVRKQFIENNLRRVSSNDETVIIVIGNHDTHQ
jgi:hypothetical protein